jgi:hypothetical protein
MRGNTSWNEHEKVMGAFVLVRLGRVSRSISRYEGPHSATIRAPRNVAKSGTTPPLTLTFAERQAREVMQAQKAVTVLGDVVAKLDGSAE